jgi:hypothetical protein
MAGEEMDIPVVVKAEAGEGYSTDSGVKLVVPEGNAYIWIGAGYEHDLGKFWKRVEKIEKSRDL